jgi:cell division protein FtsL
MNMSVELIAILITALIAIVSWAIEIAYLIHMTRKMNADDAAIYLQGRKIEEILRAMRESDAARS